MFWNVVINKRSRIGVDAIELKKGFQFTLFVHTSLYFTSFLNWIEGDAFCFFQMYLQPNNGMRFTMHWIPQNTISCLHRTHITAVGIILNFVPYLSYTDLNQVVSFENIFVYVLAAFHCCTYLKISMTIPSEKTRWAVWYNPAIVQDVARFGGEFVLFNVSSSVLWVPIHVCVGFFNEFFWKVFPAHSFCIAANTCWIEFSTRTMQHVFNDLFVQLRTIKVHLRTDKFVQVFRIHNISRKCWCRD